MTGGSYADLTYKKRQCLANWKGGLLPEPVPSKSTGVQSHSHAPEMVCNEVRLSCRQQTRESTA